jgi:hypothetical protein
MTTWADTQSTLRLLERQIEEATQEHAAMHKQHCDINTAIWDVSHLETAPAVQNPATRIRRLGEKLEDTQLMLGIAIKWLAKDRRVSYDMIVAGLSMELESEKSKAEEPSKIFPES